jgi:dTDP-4-dehydrorhamnose reductase
MAWGATGGVTPPGRTSSAGFRPMTRILVLGANGMLGSMLVRVLAGHPELDVVGSVRAGQEGQPAFEVGRDSLEELLTSVRCDWILNAIGVLDRHINASDPASVASAIAVNAEFPNRLAGATRGAQQVINFTTDGVFSGRRGPYDERSEQDAVGVYARSKGLGEVQAANVLNLRCSIVGPEEPPPVSLLGWALSQPPGATITGFTNQEWNGLTTLHLAKICAAVVLGEVTGLPSTLHVVPYDAVSKAELLRHAVESFGRTDLTVSPRPAAEAVDRRLGTAYPEINARLWTASGHARPPTIFEMVSELAGLHDL